MNHSIYSLMSSEYTELHTYTKYKQLYNNITKSCLYMLHFYKLTSHLFEGFCCTLLISIFWSFLQIQLI